MCFNVDVILTEEDYLAFNEFLALQSEYGQKMLRKSRVIFLSCIVLCAVLFFAIRGWAFYTATFAIILCIFSVFYLLFLKRMTKWLVKVQIKNLKKAGKLPFDAVARLEFHEDKLVEISNGKRVEQSYDAIKPICVIKDRYVYLFSSTLMAYVLPLPQLREQLDEEVFLQFLSEKCCDVIYY